MVPYMFRKIALRFALGLGLVCGLGLLAGCSSSTPNGARSRSTTSGGATGGSGSSTTGTLATSGSGTGGVTVGTTGTSINVDHDAGISDDGASCQHADVTFIPKIPTVFLLVDRSGSMFHIRNDATAPDGGQTTTWDLLKGSILTVVQGLQSQVRFGFGAFTGEAPEGPTCPMFDTVNPALNNYSAIESKYLSLMAPTKGETPTAEVLRKTRDLLMADTDPTATGAKYILFVTDGEPDFCDDGDSTCPIDSVVGALQEIYTQGIQTFVFGVPAQQGDISDGTLLEFANAGAGQPVVPVKNGMTITPTTIFDECQGVNPWKALFTTPPDRMNNPSLGTYGTASGTAQVYKPNLADQNALTEAIASALSTVKSCTFDLQGKIKVNLQKANLGQVSIDGNSIPYDETAANGWHMTTETQLELVGSACDTWRNTGMNISFNFPCDIIIMVN